MTDTVVRNIIRPVAVYAGTDTVLTPKCLRKRTGAP